jgi:hypothetical protein
VPEVSLQEQTFTLPVYRGRREIAMNNIIWIVGAVVIVLAVLSFFGLR